jgi:hypothetical protein
VAPYSYDWLDNLGRRSPPRLTPGLERLEVGQRVMRVFTLVAFELNHHLTLKLTAGRAIFGEIAVSYVVVALGEGRSRLLAKLLLRWPPRWPWRWMRVLLPWGDLFMMRKQLLTLKRLAERAARGV